MAAKGFVGSVVVPSVLGKTASTAVVAAGGCTEVVPTGASV